MARNVARAARVLRARRKRDSDTRRRRVAAAHTDSVRNASSAATYLSVKLSTACGSVRDRVDARLVLVVAQIGCVDALDGAVQSGLNHLRVVVIFAVESFANTIGFSVDDGEMGEIEARLSGLYPGDSVPSETDVEAYLIGEPAVPHEIEVEENRVHASAWFDTID